MSDTFERSADLSHEEKRALLAELLRNKAKESRDWSPLSHGQRALWFLHRLAPQSAAYNLMYAARIRSTLDIPALQQTVQTLVQRHPILIATYSMHNGELVQRFHIDQKVPFDVIDASSWSWQDLNDRLHEEGDRPFDLEQGPILRIKLFKRSAQDYVLSLTVHHIAADLLSLDILIDELRTLYAANVGAMQAPLPPRARQYTDYIRWQAEMLAGPEGERLWAYWQQELAGELPVLNLPTDRPRPVVQTYQGASYYCKLEEELSRRIKALATAERATLFMILLTAFEVLLLRYTNQEDILIGTPTAGRSRAELAKIVGYLVNPVVLRANISGNPTYKELLSRVRRTVLGALEHQDYPFPLLVERLQPRRDPSYSPLFQCMFIWDKPHEPGEGGRTQGLAGGGFFGETPWEGTTGDASVPTQRHPTPAPTEERSRFEKNLSLKGTQGPPPRQAQETLSLEPLAFEQRGAPFDLTLRMSEVDGSLSADFRYNVDLFDTPTIARMAQHLQTLLAGIVADPGRRIQDLPLLSAAEQHQLLVEWNDTQSDYPKDACIHQLFELQVQRTPDAVAVVFENEQLTYRELNRQANALAHTLQALGVGPDALVGVCMERSFEMVVALLGILKAGGAYVPLDPTYPRERLDYMIHDAQMPVLLTQKRLLDLLPDDGTKILCLDTDYGSTSFGVTEGHTVPRTASTRVPAPHPSTPAPTGISPARMENPDYAPLVGIGQVSQENPVSNVQPDNLVYMIYTSGSTGRPKGVMNIHRGLANRLHWMQQAYQLTAADRVLQKTPFSFDVSVWEFFWPLLTGACLVVARPGGHQDPAYLVSLIAEQRITTLHFVPSMLQVFLMTRNLERCKSLKRVICSGEALSVELQERFFSCLDAELHNLYGPTEAAIDVTYWQCQRESEQWTVPIGRPIANTQMYILNQSLQPVPIRVPGELYIGGVGVARGYFNRPELTAEKFVPDPFSKEAGKRLFKTGDLARYRPDGAIEFLGRIDYQVKLRGFRIELGEIEAVLAQHAAVKEVVVMAREDIPGDKRLVAYIVPDQESVPTHSELRSFLSGKLPDYMVPTAFVMLDALPLMPNGKVDRRALPKPENISPELQTPYVGPRTEVESAIVAIWKEVLHVEKVGIYDNFFDLGGHSLLMAQAHNLLQERLKRDLSIIELFEYPTIDALTRYLSQGKSERSAFQHSDGRAEKIKEGKSRQMQQLKQRQRAAKKGGSLNE